MPVLLTDIGGNPKAAKNEKLGYATSVLHLAPARMSGYQVCQHRSPGCEAACLHFAGAQLYMAKKEQARIRKTKLFFEDRTTFLSMLLKDIDAYLRKVDKMPDMQPALRLNATSDIPWERVRVTQGKNLMELYPDLLFYDYTAIPNRQVPDNYHLTFSLKENNEEASRAALAQGLNLAVVFFDQDLPETFWDLPVINGDETDFRPADPTPCIVGLYAKGKLAKGDQTGFVNA